MLATNNRFVYALDRMGHLLVLDYDRGKELARWDTRDWVVPVSNDMRATKFQDFSETSEN